MAAAFTLPAALSLITTSFPEGPARNRALSIYTATGASGFSLGLVAGGLLTELGWRWVFLVPAPVALVLLLVFTVVEAPGAGWGSARTIGSLAGVAALIAAFVAVERRSSHPLIRLGIPSP